MWEKLEIWKRYDLDTVACYRVYRNILTNTFSVQSLDFIRSKEDAIASNRQDIELFLQMNPDQRNSEHPTLVEAIQAFDRDFES